MGQMDDPVRSSLSKFDNDLWIERKGNVDEILYHLEDLKRSSEGLESAVAGWLQFFRLLVAECSGQNFIQDKQWGELLNLMQISRKLNHKSVKMKDLMRNRLIIETNLKRIQQYNEAARIAQNIESDLIMLTNNIQKHLVLDLPTAVTSDPSVVFLNEIGAATSFLRDQCEPLVRSLMNDLEDELVTHNPLLDKWRVEIDNCEKFVLQVKRFLSNLFDFQSKLSELSPMLHFESSVTAVTSMQSIATSIEQCGEQFREVQSFNKELIKSLIQLIPSRANLLKGKLSTDKLALVRLVNAKTLILHNIYDESLGEALQKLNQCRAEMNRVMQVLRTEFGWFYFVNDLELLKIISLDTKLATESEENQRLIKKLFNNSISRFILEDGRLVGVTNPFDETVTFKKEPILIKKQVNVYSLEIVRILNELIRKLRRSLKSMLLESFDNQDDGDMDWSLPIQLLNLKEYIRFTELVESKLSAGEGVASLIEFYKQRFAKLNKPSIRDDKAIKHSSATTLTIHFLSRLLNLQTAGVVRIDDWHWQKEIRYYRVNEEVEVRIADSEFTYKFDYLPLLTDNMINTEGNMCTFKRLISTHITERCFLVASQAVSNLKMGACPYGPAGSGKTETIKTLGQLLGCQVIVHNCDESNDIESLDRLIWGLAHTGLWGCFDEFNRLSSSVLSSVSATLELVQTSIREKRTTVELPSGVITCIEPHSAFFITLNPGDTHRYRGRRRMPANLRNLFLPISMGRVSVDTIVSEYLLALGATVTSDARITLEFGRSIQSLLEQMKMSTEGGLTEWDLRLAMAILKRLRIMINSVNSSSNPDETLADAVWCEVSPRLGATELKLLKIKVGQLFNLSVEMIGTPAAPVQSRSSLLACQLETRTGVILFGPAGSGKSKNWRDLAAAKKNHVRWLAMNPKSLPSTKLFGSVNQSDQKWSDGLLTSLVREAHTILRFNETVKQVWLILDGPINPDWVESLNSVMDDNQLLTLSSGERISFLGGAGETIKLIFETDEIEFVSPATISRLGAVRHDFGGEEFSRATNVVKDEERHPIRGHQSDVCKQRIETFLSDKKSRLMIVRQQPAGSPRKFESHFLENARPEVPPTKLFTYNCSQYSRSVHLLDLLTSQDSKTVYVLNNLRTIQAEDQWETRSFIELLRFISTYDGYYNHSMRFVKTSGKFIVTTDSLEKLNPRLKNSATIVELNVTEVSKVQEEFRIVREPLISILRSSDFLRGQPIITISSVDEETHLKKHLSDAFPGARVFEFYDTESSRLALDALSELSRRNSKTDRNCSHLFILNELQASLMDQSILAELYHLLNFMPAHEKFIYLTSNIESKPDACIFWQSMGPIVHLGCDLATSWLKMRESVAEEVSRKLSTDFKLDTSNINWLIDKMLQFLMQQKVELFEHEKLRHYVNLVTSLLNSSTREHETKYRSLSGGLDKLSDVEADIEHLKLRCQDSERESIAKKEEIMRLTQTINQAVKSTLRYREQIGELGRQQVSKAGEISEKRQNVELQLSQVLPLIEASKSDVSQFLKPEALNEIKSLRLPPKGIKDVLDVLLMILGTCDVSWTSIKSYLTKYSLKEQLTTFNFEKKLSPALITKIEREIELRREAFEPEQAARASRAILPIVGWIKACLEYGRALISLEPLKKELTQLQEESERLEFEASKTQVECEEIDKQIDLDSNRLRQLESDYESSQRSIELIQSRLSSIQKIRTNLDVQVARWRKRSDCIRSMIDGNRLIKLCLTAASLSLFVDDLDSIQGGWFSQFELGDLTIVQFVKEVLDHLIDEESLGEFIIREGDAKRLLQLALLRLCLDAKVQLPLLLKVRSEGRLSEEELVQCLSFKQIVSVARNVKLIRCDQQDDEWRKTLSLALRPRKLVIIEMGKSQLMDKVNLAVNQRAAHGADVLLIGKLEDLCPAARRQVRSVNLLSGNDSPEDMRSTILAHVTANFYPELSELVDKLEFELQERRVCTYHKEIDLLMQLASMKSEEAAVELNEDIVDILSELQSLSQSLAQDELRMEENMNELGAKQREHLAFCDQAVNFYTSHLAHLCASDRFCNMSVKRYARLLVEATKRSHSREPEAAYGFICRQVLLSARPAHKQHFLARFKLSEQVVEQNSVFLGNVIGSTQDLKVQLQLRNVIGDLLRDDSLTNSTRLMVVLHEPARSSPQLEIDELFRRRHDNKWPPCSYSKLYASINSIGRIETALGSLSSSSEHVKCLCIANAHLISSWLNARLVRLLQSLSSNSLVILVAEADDEGQLDSDVLNRAQVKYWHDDLALDLIDRYSLLRRLMPATGLSKECVRLGRQIILLHVICQERNKLSAGQAGAWRREYCFDNDQLRLALATVQRLSLAHGRSASQQLDDSQSDLRSEVRNILEQSIYSARMEEQEDELAMGELFGRVFGAEAEKIVYDLEDSLGKERKVGTGELLDHLIGSRVIERSPARESQP